jgi:hypothetical protein
MKKIDEIEIRRRTRLCKMDMTHLNSYRSNELQTSFTGMRQLLEDISDVTTYRTLSAISDTEAQKPSMFCEETLKGLFGCNSTITLHPLKVKNPEYKVFLQYAQGNKPEQILQDQFVDIVYKMVEMRVSPETRVGECLPLTQYPKWKLFRARIRAYKAINKFSILLPFTHVLRVSKKRARQSFLNYFITINIILLIMHHCRPLIVKALKGVLFELNEFSILNSHSVKL